MISVQQLAVGGFDHNFSYLISSGGEAALVDPTGSLEVLRSALHVGLTLRYILLTHHHRDHCGAVSAIFSDTPVPVLGHKDFADRERIALGDDFIEVIFTPGHTTDSVCYRAGDALLTGDTLFVDYIGFGRPRRLFETLRQVIYPLPDELIVYSGHDYGHAPFTTLGEQKRNNQYLRCATYEEFRNAFRKLD